MHDVNGQWIRFGDYVKHGHVSSDGGEQVVIGRVSELYPDAETCNVSMVWPSFHGLALRMATAGETELLVRADGTVPEWKQEAA